LFQSADRGSQRIDPALKDGMPEKITALPHCGALSAAEGLSRSTIPLKGEV